MNLGMEKLQPYPFERLRTLTEAVTPSSLNAIKLTIGEPQHPAPEIAMDALIASLSGVNKYPSTNGSLDLRATIAEWLHRRFKLQGVSPDAHIMPVTGTREALFAIAQVLVTPGQAGRVICPNPFYQIYEGAALLAGTEPLFVPAGRETGFLPDFSTVSSEAWDRCELLYLCTPGNPSGAELPLDDLKALIELAERHNFVIASDECYSEIYGREESPPPGLLEAATAMGNTHFRNCLVFHSLSKRSNLPGLRSGFVAGDAHIIDQFRRYRTYHGCAMPPHHQAASIAAWRDEHHVIENRARYREKFAAVLPILQSVLSVQMPDAGFYLWPETPCDDELFAQQLLSQCNVAVLPGSYLGRTVNGINPGAGHVRLALVAELDQCIEGAERIATAVRNT